MIYTEIDDEAGPVKNHKKNPTLGQRMDKLETTVGQLVDTVNALAEEMRAGFKQVNNRLDYIVKANDLKDLPNRK